jgi:hypothetical protein
LDTNLLADALCFGGISRSCSRIAPHHSDYILAK